MKKPPIYRRPLHVVRGCQHQNRSGNGWCGARVQQIWEVWDEKLERYTLLPVCDIHHQALKNEAMAMDPASVPIPNSDLRQRIRADRLFFQTMLGSRHADVHEVDEVTLTRIHVLLKELEEL